MIGCVKSGVGMIGRPESSGANKSLAEKESSLVDILKEEYSTAKSRIDITCPDLAAKAARKRVLLRILPVHSVQPVSRRYHACREWPIAGG